MTATAELPVTYDDCPTCHATPEQGCLTASGAKAKAPHKDRPVYTRLASFVEQAPVVSPERQAWLDKRATPRRRSGGKFGGGSKLSPVEGKFERIYPGQQLISPKGRVRRARKAAKAARRANRKASR
jgi:hypothetical protein